MGDPCKQEDKIGAIHSTLERLEDGNERLLSVLERIAEQGAFIKGLQESSARHDKAFENLFTRVNLIEVKSEGEKVKVGVIMTGISVITATVTSIVVKFWKG